MRTISFEELKAQRQLIIDSIIKGSVFIYPTDTIYGIGCNACICSAVKKIRRLKKRASRPFSAIAPSIGWIHKNCVVTEEAQEWLEMLPGPYTLILKLKAQDCISKEVNNGCGTLGVRIPNHWISKVIAGADVPFVTTSVNKSSEAFMTSTEDLDASIKSGVDFLLYEGKKEGMPSKIIDLTTKSLKIRWRC